MVTKIVAGFLIIPALFIGLLLSADYAIVDVREGGPDAHDPSQHDQLERVLAEGREQGRDDEDQQPDLERSAPAVSIAERTRRQQEAREDERVGADRLCCESMQRQVEDAEDEPPLRMTLVGLG